MIDKPPFDIPPWLAALRRAWLAILAISIAVMLLLSTFTAVAVKGLLDQHRRAAKQQLDYNAAQLEQLNARLDSFKRDTDRKNDAQTAKLEELINRPFVVQRSEKNTNTYTVVRTEPSTTTNPSPRPSPTRSPSPRPSPSPTCIPAQRPNICP